MPHRAPTYPWLSFRSALRRRSCPAALLLVAGLLLVPCARAEEADREALPDDFLGVADYLDLEAVSNPQISPDGRRVVYARSHVDTFADHWASELWILDADGSRHRFLTEGSEPRWSPDGGRIAYLAADVNGDTQIFVRWMDAEGATSQVTRVTEAPAEHRWSPDGTSIAFLALVPAEESWPIDLPAPPEGVEWTKAPRMISKTHYRQDYRGFMEEGFTHLFVVPADGGTPRQLTEGAWNAGARFAGLEYGAGVAWTPDGREILFDGLRDEAPELDGYRQNYIYAVDVETREIRQLVTRKGDWQRPAVSPDGRWVAFGGFPYTLQTFQAGDLWVVPIEGGEPKKLSGDLDREVGQIHWGTKGDAVYFTANNHGTRNLYRAGLEGRGAELATAGEHMFSLGSLSTTGIAVGTLTAPHAPNDVVRVDLASAGKGAATMAAGTITRLTHVNDDVVARKRLGAVEEIWYESTDSTDVQGWIVKPPDFDSEKEYPLILHVHGGPHAMYNVSFSAFYQNLAAYGYVVLYTNPRGSTGYGTPFANAIDNAYPSVDHEDLMAGVDAVLERGYVDPKRLYITGCSGGGVLSSWAIGHTDRFAAAAVRCPVTNWISFAGTADIVQWGYHRFDGYFWDDPTAWLEHSPLMHVGKVTTPTLLMTGELDLRTPMAQTEEYYAALKVLGVETVMLRFYDEYHGTTTKPSNFMRTVLYLVDWFDQHTKE